MSRPHNKSSSWARGAGSFPWYSEPADQLSGLFPGSIPLDGNPALFERSDVEHGCYSSLADCAVLPDESTLEEDEFSEEFYVLQVLADKYQKDVMILSYIESDSIQNIHPRYEEVFGDSNPPSSYDEVLGERVESSIEEAYRGFQIMRENDLTGRNTFPHNDLEEFRRAVGAFERESVDKMSYEKAREQLKKEGYVPEPLQKREGCFGIAMKDQDVSELEKSVFPFFVATVATGKTGLEEYRPIGEELEESNGKLQTAYLDMMGDFHDQCDENNERKAARDVIESHLEDVSIGDVKPEDIGFEKPQPRI